MLHIPYWGRSLDLKNDMNDLIIVSFSSKGRVLIVCQRKHIQTHPDMFFKGAPSLNDMFKGVRAQYMKESCRFEAIHMVKKSPRKGRGRLDLFLISSNLLPVYADSKILNEHRSGHSPISPHLFIGKI